MTALLNMRESGERRFVPVAFAGLDLLGFALAAGSALVAGLGAVRTLRRVGATDACTSGPGSMIGTGAESVDLASSSGRSRTRPVCVETGTSSA